MTCNPPEALFGVILALGAGAQILALLLPGRLMTFLAVASVPLVLLYAFRDRDVTLFFGELCVCLLLRARARP